ncbi:hypothetical protein V6N13_118580 [Hibiscus sabdariffa]
MILAAERCLFRAIAHGACLRSGEELPDETRQRELGDDLRAQPITLFLDEGTSFSSQNNESLVDVESFNNALIDENASCNGEQKSTVAITTEGGPTTLLAPYTATQPSQAAPIVVQHMPHAFSADDQAAAAYTIVRATPLKSIATSTTTIAMNNIVVPISTEPTPTMLSEFDEWLSKQSSPTVPTNKRANGFDLSRH